MDSEKGISPQENSRRFYEAFGKKPSTSVVQLLEHAAIVGFVVYGDTTVHLGALRDGLLVASDEIMKCVYLLTATDKLAHPEQSESPLPNLDSALPQEIKIHPRVSQVISAAGQFATRHGSGEITLSHVFYGLLIDGARNPFDNAFTPTTPRPEHSKAGRFVDVSTLFEESLKAEIEESANRRLSVLLERFADSIDKDPAGNLETLLTKLIEGEEKFFDNPDKGRQSSSDGYNAFRRADIIYRGTN